ncbi:MULTISPECIES: hypothetical protein [unclassified Arthrobacter]|uniref:hypothetical protein n=1 Tax=unclassified Arthrobacter TaxID=235627 RepID=UPI002E08229A|nr:MULTISPECIES: hypothetical protein [unclassified Arthrobacter]MEC5190324.1 beta-phosphoglucomutase-like phosphatase (HAD superfamily) [Arthrobacter sp. MP_M4]MEC5202697.1 beta-phosphoglucomutase-like phosphatase (HAD superfamily) [Arthrobacter sp. MP_M7]
MTGHSFELVVFDCDGLLVDSEVIAVRVDQRVLADLGWELKLEEIVDRFVGRSEADFTAALEAQAARSAGMHAFAYAGGVTPAERLAGPGITVFSDLRDLPELIASGRP